MYRYVGNGVLTAVDAEGLQSSSCFVVIDGIKQFRFQIVLSFFDDSETIVIDTAEDGGITEVATASTATRELAEAALERVLKRLLQKIAIRGAVKTRLTNLLATEDFAEKAFFQRIAVRAVATVEFQQCSVQTKWLSGEKVLGKWRKKEALVDLGVIAEERFQPNELASYDLSEATVPEGAMNFVDVTKMVVENAMYHLESKLVDVRGAVWQAVYRAVGPDCAIYYE